MTALNNPPRRPTKTRARRRGLRLPRVHWGWYLAIPVVLLATVKTWPIHAAVLLTVATVALVLAVVRPARLARLLRVLDRIANLRRALPRSVVRPLHLFQSMTPARFEHAVAELAQEHPTVRSAQAVGQANDRGADVIVQLEDGRRILIQCKRYRNGNNVGSETVQTINGVYRDVHHCHEAAIVTTSFFTRAAVETNAMLPQPIHLIDGHGLVAWANGGLPPWR